MRESRDDPWIGNKIPTFLEKVASTTATKQRDYKFRFTWRLEMPQRIRSEGKFYNKREGILPCVHDMILTYFTEKKLSACPEVPSRHSEVTKMHKN